MSTNGDGRTDNEVLDDPVELSVFAADALNDNPVVLFDVERDVQVTEEKGLSLGFGEVPTVEVAVAVPVLLPVEEAVDSEKAVAEFVAVLDCVLTVKAVKDNCGIDVPLRIEDNEDVEEEVDEIDVDRVAEPLEVPVDVAEDDPVNKCTVEVTVLVPEGVEVGVVLTVPLPDGLEMIDPVEIELPVLLPVGEFVCVGLTELVGVFVGDGLPLRELDGVEVDVILVTNK